MFLRRAVVVGGVNDDVRVRRDHASFPPDSRDRVHDRHGNKHRPPTLSVLPDLHIHIPKSRIC